VRVIGSAINLSSPSSSGDEDCVARKNHRASYSSLDLSSKQEAARGRARQDILKESSVSDGMKMPAGKKHGASDALISSKTESMLLLHFLCAKNCNNL